MSKKILVILMLILAIALVTGCKVKEETDAEISALVEPRGDYDQWEYAAFLGNCEIDNSTSQLICLDIDKNEYSRIDNMLNKYGDEGWELVDLLYVSDEGRSATTFVMKRQK